MKYSLITHISAQILKLFAAFKRPNKQKCSEFLCLEDNCYTELDGFLYETVKIKKKEKVCHNTYISSYVISMTHFRQ